MDSEGIEVVRASSPAVASDLPTLQTWTRNTSASLRDTVRITVL